MKSYMTVLASAAVVGVTAVGAMSTAGSATAAPRSQVQVATYKSIEKAPPASLLGPNGEVPVEWGVASFPNDGEFAETSSPRKSVGGGTWNYGTAKDGVYKACYSNYIHPTKKHSASVAIASQTDKDIQNADIWAKAYATAGFAHTCNTYWGVY